MNENTGEDFGEFEVVYRALLHSLRAGDGFAFGLVRDALIFVDRGRFREALAAIDDESLKLAPGESMDKPAP